MEWRFAEDEGQGDSWLGAPSAVQAHVDYRRGSAQKWRRLMVVTPSWLSSKLAEVTVASGRPLWLALPTLLVVPDGEGDGLRMILDRVLNEGLFDDYSAPL